MNDRTLVIITDAWWPQVNGVVNTLMQTRTALKELGYRVTLLTPQDYNTVSLALPSPTNNIPLPSHSDIRPDYSVNSCP
jgi:hypothetical protein